MLLGDIWNSILYIPILNLLVFFYHYLGNNMGVAIIMLTIFIKVLLFPLTKPSIEAARKQKELKPEIDKLKKKYKDKSVFAQKQMELYKEHGANPMAGCLPQIAQFAVIIALYRVFINILKEGTQIIDFNKDLYFNFLHFTQTEILNTHFLYWNLAIPDKTWVLPILAAGSQFFMSKYMMSSNKTVEETVKNTPDKSDDVMYNMQQQMAYIMPIMTLAIGFKLPSGLLLYWLISTVLSIVQYKMLNRDSSKKEKILVSSKNKNG